MSSFVDSVFAFTAVQPQAAVQDSAYQWKPSVEQVNVMMAEDNHTQAGFPFQFQVHYQSPTHTFAIANPQDSAAAASSANDAIDSSVYSHMLPSYQKRVRDVSVSLPSLPIFADDQSADAQRKAKRSRLIREYSNGILTHANVNLSGHSPQNSSGNGDFSGVLDDLSIPILFPDAKPSPLLIPADEDEFFDFQRMNNPERSPAYGGSFLFKLAASPSAAAFLAASSSSSSTTTINTFSSFSSVACILPPLPVSGSADDNQLVSDACESAGLGMQPQLREVLSTAQQLQLQQALSGSLARFLPNSPTHVAIVSAETRSECNQPEIQAQVQPVPSSNCPPPLTTSTIPVVAPQAASTGTVSESSCGSNTPRTLRSHDTRRNSVPQSSAQMQTPTPSEVPTQSQMTPSSPSANSVSTRARHPGSPQHTPSAAAVVHSSGVSIPPLRLSAARASHRPSEGDDSNRAVKQAKRITVDLTKGGVELEVFERYYQRANDGAEYKIRLIRLVNRRSGRSDVYCHAADLGGVVERKSNISRLFGQFESPREKILMNVIGAHSLSIGQESNILTYFGVRRFFDVSKMKGQLHFRRWIENVLLPDLQATTQVSAVQLLPPKNEADVQQAAVSGAAKKDKVRKESGEESDHEIDAPPSLSSDDESSSDSTDDMDDEDEADD